MHVRLRVRHYTYIGKHLSSNVRNAIFYTQEKTNIHVCTVTCWRILFYRILTPRVGQSTENTPFLRPASTVKTIATLRENISNTVMCTYWHITTQFIWYTSKQAVVYMYAGSIRYATTVSYAYKRWIRTVHYRLNFNFLCFLYGVRPCVIQERCIAYDHNMYM